MRVAWVPQSADVGGAELCLREASTAITSNVDSVPFVPRLGALRDSVKVPRRVQPYPPSFEERLVWLERRCSLAPSAAQPSPTQADAA